MFVFRFAFGSPSRKIANNVAFAGSLIPDTGTVWPPGHSVSRGKSPMREEGLESSPTGQFRVAGGSAKCASDHPNGFMSTLSADLLCSINVPPPTNDSSFVESFLLALFAHSAPVPRPKN
jgi:hypothetical protein